jgi:hypothetical protein
MLPRGNDHPALNVVIGRQVSLLQIRRLDSSTGSSLVTLSVFITSPIKKNAPQQCVRLKEKDRRPQILPKQPRTVRLEVSKYERGFQP